MNLAELLKEKREEILRITGKHGARNIRVFGSVARGEANEESDIDFLVQLESGSTLLMHAAMIRELEALLGRKVEVVSERALRQRIKNRVIQEAVPL